MKQRTIILVLLPILFWAIPAYSLEKPRICIVTIANNTGRGSVEGLRKSLENGLAGTGSMAVLPIAQFAKAAKKMEIAPEKYAEAKSLETVGPQIELDVAVIAWLSRHGKKYRLLVVAVDPFDGSQIAKASMWLKKPQLSKAQSKEMGTSLARDVVKKMIADEFEEPPPPPKK